MSALPATLETALADRFRSALKACELTIRNWSGGGEWVFSVYESDHETYVGTVRLHADIGMLDIREPKGLSRKQFDRLVELCAKLDRSSTPDDFLSLALDISSVTT